MILIVTIPVVILFVVYKIFKWLMRQSHTEREFWWDQKHLRGGRGCWIYNMIKGFLLLICIAGGLLILVSLTYGQVPTLHDLGKEKFIVSFLGAGFLALMQIGFFGLIFFIKKASKHNTGKIILFFSTIGIAAATLVAVICIAAFF